MEEISGQFNFDFFAGQEASEGETKTCNKCNKELHVSCFSPHSASNYLRPECRECNNRLSKIRKELRDIYGMPENGYKCPICGGREEDVAGKGNKNNGAWVLDHCHEEDKFRGWLCHKCNRGIGCFNDDINKLKNAISYLNL